MMKRVSLLQSLLVVFCLASTASAAPVNLSFETGDLSGWSVTNPVGISEFDGAVPAGSAQVLNFWPWGGQSASDGTSMAAIGTGNAWFLPGQGAFDIMIDQTLTVDSGTTISGSSFFYNGDPTTQDSAWVRILDGSGNVIATPWLEISGTTGSVGFQSTSPWSTWEWVAPSTGTYQLALGVSTKGDNRFSSFGIYDGIRVPEPSSMALLTLGFGSLLVKQRQRRGRR
jgi:hypothetical protein